MELTILYKKENLQYGVNEVIESATIHLNTENSKEREHFINNYVSNDLDDLADHQINYYSDEINTLQSILDNTLTDDDFCRNEILIVIRSMDIRYTWHVKRFEI